MKFLLKLLLLSVFVLWGIGTYLHFTNNHNSFKFIGFGVLILTLVLMPLFIYHRYKGKDLNQYRLDLFQKPNSKEKGNS